MKAPAPKAPAKIESPAADKKRLAEPSPSPLTVPSFSSFGQTGALPIAIGGKQSSPGSDVAASPMDPAPGGSQPPVVQAKLLLGGAHTPHEAEADRFAETMSPSSGSPARGAPAFSAVNANSGVGIPANSAAVESALGSPALPIDGPHRDYFESRLPIRLGSVRVHTGEQASSAAETLGARAFTVGRDIVFGAGQYAPRTREGGRLLAHELAHVAQQNSGGGAPNLIQRQEHDDPAAGPATADPVVTDPAPLTDEEPKYKNFKYDAETMRLNRKWFELLGLSNANPFEPYNPMDTPIAYINRVLKWQKAVHDRKDGISFSEFVFAASDAQSKVRDGVPDPMLVGIDDVSKSIKSGTFKPGLRVDPDGVLGAATLWTMMVAYSMAARVGGLQLLKKAGIPYDTLWTETDLDNESGQAPWRATHAFLFNKPKYRAKWTTIAQADIVIDTFESINILADMDQTYLENLFFEGKEPENTTIVVEDLMAILARGYQGEALEGIASLFEVDRTYYHSVDIERFVRETNPDWLKHQDLRMAETLWPRANTLINRLQLDPPSTREAQAALKRLEENSGSTDKDQPMSVLGVAYQLPDRTPEFWHETAKKYVDDKVALEKAAEEATQEKLASIHKQFEARMAGTPDIQKTDAMAFLELLVGDAFMRAQNKHRNDHAKYASGDLLITEKLQDSTAGAKAKALYSLAQEKEYLVVQLGDDSKGRFPLAARQIDASREAADRNGESPLIFDLIDTPHAAMHTYLPTRFTARKTDDGSEAASNPWELSEEKDALAWENWKSVTGMKYGTFDPVLVELHQFNPDAGQLVRLWRQTGGSDKIMVQYVWTLGGSLPSLSENLWSAQTKINIVGWIDAIFTIVALATLISAPLAAGVEAEGAQVAGGVARAAVNAAMRRALVMALRKFVISEAIGEILNRISYHLNEDPDVPDSVKTAWNGLMVLLLIWGASKMVRQGIKAYKNVGSAKFRVQLAALEKELEASAKAGKGEMTAGETAAQAEVKQKTTEKFNENVAPKGGEAPEGAGRVRSDDPRTAGVSEKPANVNQLTPDDSAVLRKALGDEAAEALAAATNNTTRKRLSLFRDPEIIRRIMEAVKPKELARLLASVDAETLRAFAAVLEKEVLQAILKAFSGKPPGIRLMKAFAGDPERLARLLAGLDAKTLMSIAGNPGAERFALVAAKVDPAALISCLKNMGTGKAGSLTRFRNLLEAVGPDQTAQVLNTYTAGEIKARWNSNGKLSPAQNVARLAIQREGVPTVNRTNTGTPVPKIDNTRPARFEPGNFTAFYAVGPENAAPAVVRKTLKVIQAATATAANKLEDLIRRANAGALTDADMQGLAPEARATVQAFLNAPPKAANRDALYGSALQYMAEAELRSANGGALPEGLVVRRPEVRGDRTIIPDAQIELTLKEDLRFPKKNKTERVVFDWTTTGQAGKIEKYAGGQPPVTYGVEIIQPGPPPAAPPKVTVDPPIHPKVDVEPDTDTPMP